MPEGRVLIIEDSASLALGYAAQLEEVGYEVSVAETIAEAEQALAEGTFDVALLDLQLPDGNGLSLLETPPDMRGATTFVVITSDGSLTRAISAMRLGAYDFLVKPVSGTRLLTTVRNAHDHKPAQKAAEPEKKAAKAAGFHGFIGQSPVMRDVYRTIENVADSKATIFITGESGTGKEVTAEAIHAAGRRRSKPFVAINCGAIPENLLESELFGHVKGAFTGAVENRIGAAKAADGGTLFLDEICEMDLKLQVKLLRFLQTAMIQRVGSPKAEPVDVRIVCATNRDPAQEVMAGRFREDLYYRLNVIPISLPPLRARGGDVRLIAEELVRKIGREEGHETLHLSPESLAYVAAHDWPGNVRELQNAIRRAIVTGSGEEVELSQAPARFPSAAMQPPHTPDGMAAASTGPDRPTAQPGPLAMLDLAGMTMEDIEKLAIDQAIARHGGNVSKAARALELSPSTVYRKLERWSN